MNFRDITVPNVAIGALVKKMNDNAIGRYLLGTSSPMAVPKESWMASPKPYMAAPTISPATLGVNAQRITPTRATTFPMMKNLADCQHIIPQVSRNDVVIIGICMAMECRESYHLRPKRSLSRPMTAYVSEEANVRTILNHEMYLDTVSERVDATIETLRATR